MSSSSSPQFPKLNSHNYNTWSGEMQAWLRAQGVWRIVAATSLAPKLPATPTDVNIAALDAWELKSDKACGWMYLSIEDDQKIHLKGIEGDPVKIWAALRDVHLQKRPGMHMTTCSLLGSMKMKLCRL
jgi:Domain of unknown function (DUF4219)